MKIFIRKIRRINNLVLTGLISLLGFTFSCETSDEPELATAYGCPNADYIVKGKITSETTGETISSIKVVMGETYSSDDKVYFYGIDSLTTDDQGNYELSSNTTPLDTVSFVIHIEDIDGEENGVYQEFDTTVTYIDSQFTGGSGSWYKGEVTQELNIELVPSNEVKK